MGNTCSPLAFRRVHRADAGDDNDPSLPLDPAGDNTSLSSSDSNEDDRLPEVLAAREPSEQGLRRRESLENLLTCSICMDIVFEPVSAPCQHYFCRACLRRLLQYQGPTTLCPKCRKPLGLEEARLHVSRRVARTVATVFGSPSEERAQMVAQEDTEYRAARAVREHEEHLMQENPLQLFFEGEADPHRRELLQRDVATLQAMGFSVVQAQKALFLWSGVHYEAVNWLVMMQGTPDLDVPWNATQLQEQTLVRQFRRSLLSLFSFVGTADAVPGRLRVAVSQVALVGASGRLCWCFRTAGMHALGHSEIVILLLKEDSDTEPPQDILAYLGHLYFQVAKGLALDDLACTALALGRPFLGCPLNSGFIFARHCGQIISGLPVPPAPFLFGILLRGSELQWARLVPARLLLLLGRHYQSDFPFPLWGDRRRAPLVLAEHTRLIPHLAVGLKLPGTVVVRTRTPTHGYIHLLLPQESQQGAVQFLETWPAAKTLSIIGGLGRGVGCYLVHTPGRPRKAVVFSTPSSQGNTLGTAQCVLVQQKFNGGMVEADGLVMGLTPAAFQHVVACIKMGRSCRIEATVHRGVRHLGLRLHWLPRAIIESGVAHVLPEDDPARPVFHPLAIAAACSPRSNETVSLPPFLSRQMECLDLHPRISVTGITIVTPRHLVAQRVEASELDVFIVALVMTVNALISPQLVDCEAPASTVVLHVDLFPDTNVRYRVTKNWGEQMPQAPAATLELWRAALQRVAVPCVLADSVNLHITLHFV